MVSPGDTKFPSEGGVKSGVLVWWQGVAGGRKRMGQVPLRIRHPPSDQVARHRNHQPMSGAHRPTLIHGCRPGHLRYCFVCGDIELDQPITTLAGSPPDEGSWRADSSGSSHKVVVRGRPSVSVVRQQPQASLLVCLTYTCATQKTAKRCDMRTIILAILALLTCSCSGENDFGSKHVQNLIASGKYSEAMPLASESYNAAVGRYGEDHPITARCMTNLGRLHAAKGQYDKAEPLLTHALRVYESAYGENHRETAAALSNLAAIYRLEGRYADAQPLNERAVAVAEKVCGPDDPDTATCLTHLGGVYEAQGNFDDAIASIEQALAILEKAPEQNSNVLAESSMALARVYKTQRLYDKAEPHYLRAIQLMEQCVGRNNPKTATVMCNLGALYGEAGNYEKAEKILGQAIAIYSATVGPMHPSTRVAEENLEAVEAARRSNAERK
jgi:tetratricopeptide (TPR) repeat protein